MPTAAWPCASAWLCAAVRSSAPSGSARAARASAAAVPTARRSAESHPKTPSGWAQRSTRQPIQLPQLSTSAESSTRLLSSSRPQSLVSPCRCVRGGLGWSAYLNTKNCGIGTKNMTMIRKGHFIQTPTQPHSSNRYTSKAAVTNVPLQGSPLSIMGMHVEVTT